VSCLGGEKRFVLAVPLDLSAYMLVRDNGEFVPIYSSGFDFLVN